LCFFLHWYSDHCALHSFPTRRSSDLDQPAADERLRARRPVLIILAHRLRRGPERFLKKIGEQRVNIGVGIPHQFIRDVISEAMRSEEHTSELQSLAYLVCRLLLEKKK